MRARRQSVVRGGRNCATCSSHHTRTTATAAPTGRRFVPGDCFRVMDMRSLVAEEARRLRLKRAQTEATVERASNPAAWRQPTCRHCPTLRHDRMEAAINPLGGHLLLRRESPTSVHIAVAKRPFATYCDYLQDRAPGARPRAAEIERTAVSRYLERFRLGRATEGAR